MTAILALIGAVVLGGLWFIFRDAGSSPRGGSTDDGSDLEAAVRDDLDPLNPDNLMLRDHHHDLFNEEDTTQSPDWLTPVQDDA